MQKSTGTLGMGPIIILAAFLLVSIGLGVLFLTNIRSGEPTAAPGEQAGTGEAATDTPTATLAPSQSVITDTQVRQTVASLELLGEVTFASDLVVSDTLVGGLSGIVYDLENDVYYALSDDRSQEAPARFYRLSIDLSDGTLDEGDVTFIDATILRDENGEPFAEGSLDPEGIARSPAGTLYISSEGESSEDQRIMPFVREFGLDGQQLGELPVDGKFEPTEDSGVRNNQAFESLTISPDGRTLYTATEGALVQDGPEATLDTGTQVRVIQYDLTSGEAVAEYVYVTDPVAEESDPSGEFQVNGLVELLATDNNGTLLALERSFSTGVGNTVKLYEALSQGALDVMSEDSLYSEEEDAPFEIDPPLLKGDEPLVNIADLGITPDNLEALAFGPDLPDGRSSLIIVSDNNFADNQVTQFLAMAVEFERTPAALPALETPQFVDEADAELAGDSDDPAIWVHPDDPADSLVIATVKDGGLVVFDLDGELVDTIEPRRFGSERFNNVDLVYGFELDEEPVDLAVVSDRANDTLVIFSIDPDNLELTDVTSLEVPDTIFEADDGEQTAYGLATYTSPESGLSYAFVTQRDGAQVAQLELFDDGDGLVGAEIVRMLELPTPTGEAEDSQSEGTVVDRELGYVYVAMEEEVGVLRFDAEPDGDETGETVISLDEPFLLPDIEGLTIYYGADGEGYLLVSSQGNSSFAVFSRGENPDYLGSFVVGQNDDIDQVNESDGADVINVSLGDAFPNGLFVAQDGANDPQVVAVDEEELENRSTNFKFIPWENIATAFPEALVIDTETYDPRGATE